MARDFRNEGCGMTDYAVREEMFYRYREEV
jgi:hypothetical protein